MKILLDSGHGRKDPGAISESADIKEKDLALNIVFKAGNILREAGHNVLFTRDRDIYISPTDRLKMILNYNPDCFVSVHINASVNPQAHGIETIYRDSEDYFLAASIHKSLLANTEFKDRGIKQEQSSIYPKNLMVIEDKGRIPSCLTEIGFISNEEDLSMMDEENETENIAQALAAGILEWS